MIYDHLRPPLAFDPQAAAYKEWLHLNLLDHDSGSVGVINLSLHGAPGDPRSRAIGTALVYRPDLGWVGNLEIHALSEAVLGEASIGLHRTALAASYPAGVLMASVQDPDSELFVRLTAQIAAPPLLIDERWPLGHGWISWYTASRLTVIGEWTVGKTQGSLRKASAYHDHNWGRWHWGDDFGWEWGCFHTPLAGEATAEDGLEAAPSIAAVLALTTDRSHQRLGPPLLAVDAGRRRLFRGLGVRVTHDGTLDKIERRLPGALAALHQDQIQVRLPKRVVIQADDGFDQCELEFIGRSAAQLINGDPIVRGYSFIHEIAGEFSFSGRLGGVNVSGAGLGLFEYGC